MKKVLAVVALALMLISGVSLAADFNGDGTNDIGIFRSSSGLWAIRGVTRVYFGSSDDDPMPGDYNGDGTVDIGLFRPASGLWAIRGITRVYFGGSNDEPLAGISAGGALAATLPRTGQNILSRIGDDAYYKKGRNVLLDNGDGTVTDSRTGLMWPKDGTGAGYSNQASKTWDAAIDWAEALNFAGYTDWRLPNINELKSFQEVTWGYYQSQPYGNYWSSTTCSANPLSALYIGFYDGNIDNSVKTPNNCYVVAVRGGL